MRKRKAALYDPYLATLGGGEKHILSIFKVLEEDDYDVHVFWDQNLTAEIKTKLGLTFQSLTFSPNIFKTRSSFEKIKQLQQYDIFFYVTDGSYFFTTAKKNYIFIMYPSKQLLPTSLLTRLKTLNYTFICNSPYTQKWLTKWGVKSQVILPYLSKDFLERSEKVKKEKLILSVGRFFKHLHSKRHDVGIRAFKDLRKQIPELESYRYVIAGGLQKEDTQYLEELKKLIGKDSSIELHPNISYSKLHELYSKASLYWHFAGFGIDQEQNPDQVEHLGITPLEAMAYGIVPFCYNAGGPQEIIQQGKTGFLFTSEHDLAKHVKLVIHDEKHLSRIRQEAREYVKANFSYKVFKERVKQVLG